MNPDSLGFGHRDFKIPILFGVVIALVAANVYLFIQLDRVRSENAKVRDAVLSEVSNLRETIVGTTQSGRRTIDTLREELDAARRQAALAAGQAKVDAQKHAEDLARRLEAEQKRQLEQVKQVRQEITQVQETASAQIGEVSTEVGSVRKEVAANKSEMEATIADLKRMNGDLGIQSGLIATNSREIAALRALGDRGIFEFNLIKTKAPVKVGDIMMKLKSADMKRNRYTVEIVSDDKKFEKKDKNINEPVQFYQSKFRQPTEIVVNQIQKDRIVGYMAQPKAQAPRT